MTVGLQRVVHDGLLSLKERRLSQCCALEQDFGSGSN